MNVIGYTESIAQPDGSILRSIRVTLDGDQNESSVPDDMGNRHRFQIWDEWEMGLPDPETGERVRINTIPPYAPPAIDLSVYTATKRWEREVGGIVVGGLDVATDDRSKIMISGARIKADKDPDFTAQWKCPDGGFMTLDASTIILASDAVLDHVNDCFSIEAAVLADIADGAITMPQEVDAAFAVQLSPQRFQTRA
ncbi:DUF4376 domain-containing protein [Rhizobiales bacterium RZME27]|uniref:DUF4376 domain-containing protein n=1 Tax=Endobacterium cereale TaxID=2663029 RepID=A0A6A8A1R0_9HYPH|nr:DUF4376 domain-containing protein [Endobacterium cereale]MQY44509.1 DUF4376 domain-containing protein [Endobacterium cereale]